MNNCFRLSSRQKSFGGRALRDPYDKCPLPTRDELDASILYIILPQQLARDQYRLIECD